MAIEVKNDESQGKYFAEVGGGEAVVWYERTGDHTLDFRHTIVPEALRGGGIGEELVRGALEDARRRGDKVIPSCPFVAHFIDRHPEYRRDVAEQ
jgi:uncharacterized protein